MGLIVIVGPSAAGKSVVARQLHRDRVIRIQPTWTTRPRRRHEAVRTFEHVFVDEVTFEHLDADGAFVATATLPDLAHRYGLPRPDPADTPPPAVIARAAQVPVLRAAAGPLTVVAVTDSRRRAAERLAARGLSATETWARLRAHDAEAAAAVAVADQVVVNSSTLPALIRAVASGVAA